MVLNKSTVDLPKKHERGGQSALRFARLRTEKQHKYVRKSAELATQFINPATSQPNVSRLILVGSAVFRTELNQFDMFDQRLQFEILNVVDVSYGNESCGCKAVDMSDGGESTTSNSAAASSFTAPSPMILREITGHELMNQNNCGGGGILCWLGLPRKIHISSSDENSRVLCSSGQIKRL